MEPNTFLGWGSPLETSEFAFEENIDGDMKGIDLPVTLAASVCIGEATEGWRYRSVADSNGRRLPSCG